MQDLGSGASSLELSALEQPRKMYEGARRGLTMRRAVPSTEASIKTGE